MGPGRDLSFCAYKTAWLTSELLVSMSPISHVWFLDAKQRLLDRNNKSLWVPDITCRCVHENSVIRTRISGLYVSQTSSVVLSTHNWLLNTKIKRVYWFQPSPVVLCMQNSEFWTRITSLYGSQTWPFVLCMYDSVISTRITRLYEFQAIICCFVHSKQRLYDRNCLCLWVPDLTCDFLHAKRRA